MSFKPFHSGDLFWLKRRVPVVLAMLFVFLSGAEASRASSGSEKALPVYQGMNAFYKRLGSASLKASFKHSESPKPVDVSLAMKRPDCFSLMTNDKSWGCAASDGSHLVCFTPEGNSYSIRRAPTRLNDIFKTQDFGSVVILCANWSIDDLLAGQNPSWVGDGSKIKAAYLGVEVIRNRKCHHISFDEASIAAKTREFWIDAGKDPWLLRERYGPIVVDYSNEKKNPALDSAAFSYTPPAGARKVPEETLMNEIVRARMPGKPR